MLTTFGLVSHFACLNLTTFTSVLFPSAGMSAYCRDYWLRFLYFLRARLSPSFIQIFRVRVINGFSLPIFFFHLFVERMILLTSLTSDSLIANNGVVSARIYIQYICDFNNVLFSAQKCCECSCLRKG